MLSVEDNTDNNFKLCDCGCNTQIPVINKNGEIARFKKGHNRKGKKYIDKIIYKMITRKHHKYASPNGQIYEHRYFMELQLGRYLKKGEVIHHINGIKDDNRIENLKLYNNHKEHRNEHYPDLDNRICLLCGSNKTYMNIRKSKYKVPCWYKYDNGFICEKCHTRENKRRNNKEYSDRDLLKHKLQMELLKQFIK